MTANRKKFFIENSLKGILRNKKKYILLAVIVIAVSAAANSFFLISSGAGKFVSEKRGMLAFDDSVSNTAAYEEINSIEGIYFFSNIIIMAFGFMGIAAAVFTIILICGDRIREVGILYALGMDKSYIAKSMILESVSFLFSSVIIGTALSAIIVNIVFALGHLEQIVSYVSFSPISFIPSIAVAVIAGALASLISAVRILKAAPLEILRKQG